MPKPRMHPDQPPIHWGSAIIWRGTVRARPLHTGSSFVGLGTHRHRTVFYPISAQDADGLALINWVAEVTVDPSHGWPHEGWFRPVEIAEFLHHFGALRYDWLDVPAMLHAADCAYENPMIDRDPLPRWVEGRVGLIGYAAHPMYPTGSNGASQEIVDGHVPGAMMLAHGVTQAALAAYDARLCAPVSAVQLRNRGAGPFGLLTLVETRSGGVFEDIDAVTPATERAELIAGYKAAAGFAMEALNAAPTPRQSRPVRGWADALPPPVVTVASSGYAYFQKDEAAGALARIRPKRQRHALAREPCPAILDGLARAIHIDRNRAQQRRPDGKLQLRGHGRGGGFCGDLCAGAGVIGQAMGRETRRDRRVVAQVIQECRKACGRKDRVKERDGRAIGQTEAFEDMDLRVGGKGEGRRLARVGAPGFQKQDAPVRHPSGGHQILVKPHPAPQRIGGGAVAHEDAGATAGMHRARCRQIGQRAAQRVAVHAEAVRKLCLGGQPVARAIMAARDVLRDLIADRRPERGSSHACHQSFTQRPLAAGRGL